MPRTASVCSSFCEPIPVASLRRYLDGWVLEGEIRGLSERTLRDRRIYVQRILWFIQNRQLDPAPRRSRASRRGR